MSIYGNDTDIQSWDMASSQMTTMKQMAFEKEKYEEEKRRYGQEYAMNLLMQRNDLSNSQKRMILEDATTTSQLASAFQDRNQAAAANRKTLTDQRLADRSNQALSAGILSGMRGGSSQSKPPQFQSTDAVAMNSQRNTQSTGSSDSIATALSSLFG